MLRLRRFTRIIEEHWVVYGFSRNILEMSKFILIAILTCHCLACVWIITECKITISAWVIPHSEDDSSWLAEVIALKGDPCVPDVAHDVKCVYNLAMYWAMMTLTTVG